MKTTTKSLILSLAFALISLATQASNIKPFHSIVVSGNLEIELIHSDDENLDFQTDEYETNVQVKKGVLYLRRLKITDKHKHTVRIKLSFRNLNSISARAGAVVFSNEEIQSVQIEMDAHSGAQIELMVLSENVDAKASEGAQIRLGGATKSFDTKAGTGGEINAFELQSDYTYARATTGGMVYVTANKFIEAKSTLGGEVEYQGDPEETRTNTTLGGDVDGGDF